MKLKHLLTLLEAGGEKAGEVEIGSTSTKDAKKFVNSLIEKSDHDFATFLVNFEANYEEAKQLASRGNKKRAEMPVIDVDQINSLQMRMETGHLDIVDGEEFIKHKGFPDGLSKSQAEEWLKRGLKDGDEFDDIFYVTKEISEANELIPVQEQIYFDKAVKKLVENGVKSTKTFLQDDSLVIISKDGYIMDGHHRWLSAMLIDPSMKIGVVRIDIEKDKLINLLIAYSDAIGNDRNK